VREEIQKNESDQHKRSGIQNVSLHELQWFAPRIAFGRAAHLTAA